jgi:YbbR domain-containing protein
MKNLLTKNLGLKIVSVLGAFVLWLVVVNVDDPVISKTYTGIPVEVTNEDVLSSQGKCYDILGDSNSINVVVTAHRSVIDGMSRDYIKATADMRMLTSLDTIPIEVRSTRFSDRIESVTTRESSLKLKIENIAEKELPVSIGYEGEPAEGYILGGVENALSTITVSGPESVIARVTKIMAVADIKGINRDFSATEPLFALDENNERIDDDRIKLSRTVTEIKYIIYSTKTIPISSGYSGEPAAGFGTTGSVLTDPSSVVIAGKGENYDDMNVIYISPDEVSVEGASTDVEKTVSIANYLPTGVIFASPDVVTDVKVTVGIAQNQHKVIDVPLSNITIDNVPDGYVANIVDIGSTLSVEIQGIGDEFDRYSGDLAIGSIDATSLVPRGGHEAGTVPTGECDGTVAFNFPTGVSQSSPVTLMVVVDRVGGGEDSADVMPTAGAAIAE